MVEVGDRAPDFTAPLANGDVEEFTLSERLDEAPIVLAFFPAAFTRVCSHEMSTFRDRREAFEAVGATVYGVSIDSPFSLNAFRDELDLGFDLVSDVNRELIEKYDVAMDFPAYGIRDIAKRAVFVVDENGEIAYRWVAEDARNEPDYDELAEAAAAAATA